MKTSAALFLTDILPEKRKLLNKIVKNNIFGKLSLREVFEFLKESGVDGVELFLPSFDDRLVEDSLAAKRVLDENDMPVLSVHQPLRFFTKTKIDEITKLFAISEMLGAKVIVLHMSTTGRQVYDEEFTSAIHALEKKYGITVGFENREKYFGSLLASYGWDQEKFPSLMKEKNLHITLDTCHLAQSGGDIIEFFKKNKERIVNIHISDFRPHILNSSLRPLRYKHLPLGKGQLPIQEFLETLRRENYKGLVTMEIHSDLNGMCESAKMIKE